VVRSGIVNTIRELAVQGKPIRSIAKELGLARNTVRKYLRDGAAARARPKRPSKLDPYMEQLRRWVVEDHQYNCETLVRRLQAAGYCGKTTLVKDFVRPLRPRAAGRQPVVRYETKPGEQLQFDWGACVDEQDGATRKLFGFTAVLSYSRMRYVVFAKRCDTPSLIRCLLEAVAYFGGLPRAVLTDRMKTVLLEMESGAPHWQPRFQELVSALGITPRVCKAYTPQTKGKVERSIGLVTHEFWPGVRFGDLDDLNAPARGWCDQLNGRVHRTTHQRPVAQLAAEGLRPLPQGWAWERFVAEERRVSWDGYISYDGVLYGLPSRPGEPALAGAGRRACAGQRLAGPPPRLAARARRAQRQHPAAQWHLRAPSRPVPRRAAGGGRPASACAPGPPDPRSRGGPAPLERVRPAVRRGRQRDHHHRAPG
jgi:transposase